MSVSLLVHAYQELWVINFPRELILFRCLLSRDFSVVLPNTLTERVSAAVAVDGTTSVSGDVSRV